MATLSEGDNSGGIGLFASETCIGSTCASTDNKCDLPDLVDCASASNAKCKASKAFIIIGILANTAAVGLVVSGAGPAIAGPAAGGVASFSYMVVFAIFASVMNASGADCGLADREASYGAAFILTVIAFLLCGAGAGAAMMAGKAE